MLWHPAQPTPGPDVRPTRQHMNMISTDSDSPVHVSYDLLTWPGTVEIDGRTLHVVAPPLRFFRRRPQWWMEPGLRAPRGTGAGIIDEEVLRLETRLGLNPRSQITTMQLTRRTAEDPWELREVLRAA